MPNFLTRSRALGCAVALALVVSASAPVRAQTGGGYDLGWNVIAGGGASQASGGVFTLGGTFGQAAAVTSTGGAYRLDGGFWNGIAIRQLVDVPVDPGTPRPRLALGGFTRNPASRSALEVSFTLASNLPAELELVDVGGRRVRAEPVGSLGAGPHHVRFARAEAIGPGVYWLRLRQDGVQRVIKAIVLE